VDPRAGLGGCGKSLPHRDSILGPSSPQRCAIPAHVKDCGLLRIDWFVSYRKIVTLFSEIHKKHLKLRGKATELLNKVVRTVAALP
jgi:hypothetical protein